MVTPVEAATKERIRLRAQPGASAGHGAITTGSASLPAIGHRVCAWHRAARRGYGGDARGRVAWPRSTARRSPGIDDSLPCGEREGDRARAGSRRRAQLPAERGRKAVIADAGIQSKPYLPAIHLMSFYRERLGEARGRSPCASALRSAPWRCPSSRSWAVVEVEQVGAARASQLGRGGSPHATVGPVLVILATTQSPLLPTYVPLVGPHA